MSHLNATVTARIVPAIEKITIEPSTSFTSDASSTPNDDYIVNEPNNEEKSAKKPKIKSIYDKSDDSQPTSSKINFTPITKTTPNKSGVKPKKSHLANDDDPANLKPIEIQVDKPKPKKSKTKK